MCLVGALPWLRGLFLTIAQILGGITAAAICSALFPGPLTVRTNLGGGTSIVQGLFIEMFLTAELVFTIFMLAAEKHKGTFIAPVGIGLSLFVAELTGTQTALCYLFLSLLTFTRRLFYRWFRQSRPILRSLSRLPPIPRLSLDILGWTYPWLTPRIWFLQIHQDARVRNRKPRSRPCQRGPTLQS
jgi:hypothetical protein